MSIDTAIQLAASTGCVDAYAGLLLGAVRALPAAPAAIANLLEI